MTMISAAARSRMTQGIMARSFRTRRFALMRGTCALRGAAKSRQEGDLFSAASACYARTVSFRQRHANNLLVIPHIRGAIGKRRVRPEYLAAPGVAGGIEQVGAADLLVALGAQPGDDQITLLVDQEEAVAILDEKDVAGVGFLAVVGRHALP